jgi:tRNA threonylcarbamoyladenosine biosynthesis protein TsaE
LSELEAFRIQTSGPSETEAVGEALGRMAVPGLVVALQGALGAGKTVFTKGVARGLEVPFPQYVSSPTFTIHRVYQGRLTLHHLDLYRLSEAGQLEDLGLEEALSGAGMCVIEWPDLFFSELPADRLTVRLASVGEEQRILEFEAHGSRALAVWNQLIAALHSEGARKGVR